MITEAQTQILDCKMKLLDQFLTHYYHKCALKIGLASLLATLLPVVLQLKLGFFIIITVLVLMTLFYDKVFSKGLERLFGALISVVITLGLAKILIGHPLLFIGASFVLLSIFAYFIVVEIYHYAAIMGAITTVFIPFAILY